MEFKPWSRLILRLPVGFIDHPGMAYIGMALFYEENPDMKAFHNAYNPGMVAFMQRAMNFYAHQNL